jgi:hypothetical protein
VALASPHFEQSDIMRRLRAIDKQAETNARYAQGATIGAGGTTIKDDGAVVVVNQNGTAVVRLGRLSDGSYGAAAINSQGIEVPLSKLFFSERSVRTETNISVTGDNADPRIMQRTGPTIEAYEVGQSGKLRVDLSAVFTRPEVPLTGQAPAFYFGVYVDGPVNRTPLDDWLISVQNITMINGTSQAGATVGTSATFFLEDLPSGTYSIQMALQTGQGRTITVTSREMIVRTY